MSAYRGRSGWRAEPSTSSGRSASASTREIAGALAYSERTVKNVVHDLMMKLNCRNRAHAVALATRQGVI
jgi:DNA-binding CsgD family transcriptional regulator